MISQQRLDLVRLISVDGSLLLGPGPHSRILRLLNNYRRWNLPKPLMMLAVHDKAEEGAAADFQANADNLGTFHVVPQERHNERRSNAADLYWQYVDPAAKDYRLNRGILHLARRGGTGQPTFIDKFTEGMGTTCAAWTPDSGFVQAGVATGHCPVGCKVCYLQGPYREAMTVFLNLEDLEAELQSWQGHLHPINFSAKSGLIEYDRWFCNDDGEGSIAQFIIDACAKASVIPYFLTKIVFPRYLRFDGTVQVGISLMPENIRKVIAPFGSPTEELLSSLEWAVSAGAVNPGIRLFALRQYLDQYVPLLKLCRQYLGQRGWQLTVDVPRFASDTLSKIAIRYPNLAPTLAQELDPNGGRSLREIAGQARGKSKQLRPPLEQELQVYREIRRILDEIGCQEVPITACKGDPQALLPLVHDGVLCKFPCACYAPQQACPVVKSNTSPITITGSDKMRNTSKPQKAVPADAPPRTPYQMFSPLTSAEYASLKQSIAERGVDVPTIHDAEGNIIDGWHREMACWELRIQCPREVRSFASEAEKYELTLTANCKRRQLNRKQRRELIGVYLKCDPAISDNTLAAIIGGISKNNVTKVRKHLEATHQIPKLTAFRGRDGKVRPRQYKRILANNQRELKIAQATIRSLPDNCNGKMLDLTTASRRARRNVKREILAGEVVVPTPDQDIRLYNCRFQELAENSGIAPGSVQAFILDIPYDEEFLDQLPELAAMAQQYLASGGVFVCYVGTMFLNKVFRILDDHLTFVPPQCSVWTGDANILHKFGIVNHWKPIVVYSKGPWKARKHFSDVSSTDCKQKALHPWQQPFEEIEGLVANFTEPGDLVVDCVAGSFTTALACRNLGRRFVGCDIDERCVLQGYKRLAETPVAVPVTPLAEPAARSVSSDCRYGDARFHVAHGDKHRLVVAPTPQTAALHVAKQYLLNQTGNYNRLLLVRVGDDDLCFWMDTLFKELGYELAS
ncbi:MAG: DNA methyltransferase [Thermoguttaceae bacterium]